MNQGERIARLEEQVSNLTEDVRELKAEVKLMNEQLHELLQLKHKGMGAFWLVSIVIGSAIAVFAKTLIEYFAGAH